MIPSLLNPAKNYKGVVDMFAQIAADATFIASFSFGSFREKLIEDETPFPQLYLECLPFAYEWEKDTQLNIPVVFYVLDLAEPSQDETSENNLDIQAKIEQIARNVVKRIETQYGEWVPGENLNPSFLMDKLSTSKRVKYCRVEVLLQPPFGMSVCDLPFADREFEPDACDE